jgi:hypothetical protein
MGIRHNLGILLVTCFTIISCKRENEKQVVTKNEVTGVKTIIDYNDSSAIKSIVSYKDEKKEGPAYFFEENVLTWKANYKNDSLTGPAVLYFPSGAVKGALNYVNGNKVGEQTYYFENGQVREKQWGSALGELEDFIRYKPDGTRDSTGTTPLFINAKESIKLNKEHTFEIRLGNRVSEDTYVMIGKLPNSKSTFGLVDTLDVLTNDDYKFKYTFKPTKLGEDSISGKIEHLFFTKDSWKGEEYPFTYKFTVVD